MTVAIASGKGGTGKTTIAVNLAHYASRESKVLLVDLDVEEPDVLLFFPRGDSGSGLPESGRKDRLHRTICKEIPEWKQERCSSCGLCTELCAFHALIQIRSDILVFPQLCHSCGACTGLCPEEALVMYEQEIGTICGITPTEHLTVIESRLQIGEEQPVPQIRKTKQFLRELEKGYDYVFYDAPPGSSCPMVEVVRDADLVILVTEPTPFGLHDLSLAYEAIKNLGRPAAAVINRWGIGNSEVEEFCHAHNIPVAARIPDSRETAVLLARGEMVWPRIENFADSISAIFRCIVRFSSEKGNAGGIARNGRLSRDNRKDDLADNNTGGMG